MVRFEDVDSRFIGMITVLARILLQDRDGRLRPISGADMGYAVRRPRRA